VPNSLEEGLVRKYVWDKGLMGFSNHALANELCEELGIGETDVVRKTLVKVLLSLHQLS